MHLQVGDKITLHFRNKLPFPASIQLFGGMQVRRAPARPSLRNHR
jgi:hypothetical protein